MYLNMLKIPENNLIHIIFKVKMAECGLIYNMTFRKLNKFIKVNKK